MDKKLYINPPLVERAYDWKNGPQPKTRKELDKFSRVCHFDLAKRRFQPMAMRV